jgi:hypothetical protein
VLSTLSFVARIAPLADIISGSIRYGPALEEKGVLSLADVKRLDAGDLRELIPNMGARNCLREQIQKMPPPAAAAPPAGTACLNAAIGGEFSFADVELLLSNLILFDTFIFGFTVTLMTTTFNHDDLLAADQRYWKLEPGFYKSHSFLFCCVAAALILITSLMIGLMLAISLGFSKCREQPDSFQRWIVLGQPLTCIAYLLFIVGFGFFFVASSQAVDMKFPRYPLSPTRGATYQFDGEDSLRFNSTNKTLILVETANQTYDGKYVREWWYPLHDYDNGGGGRSFGLGWVFAYRAFYFSVTILLGSLAFGIFGIALFNIHDNRHKRHHPGGS